jgi:hypothetical protein
MSKFLRIQRLVALDGGGDFFEPRTINTDGISSFGPHSEPDRVFDGPVSSVWTAPSKTHEVKSEIMMQNGERFLTPNATSDIEARLDVVANMVEVKPPLRRPRIERTDIEPR